MTNLLQYALLGIGVGAIYALLGQGIVLIYRGSGVLNIAQGGFAMVGAYLYLQLHSPGSLGTSFSTQTGWPVLPAFVVAVAATAALGLATDQLLLRRMRKASPLARLVVTVCVLLVLEAVAVKIWGAAPPFVPQLLPSEILTIGGASLTLPTGYLWLLGIAVGLTLVLTLVWRFTRIGWVTAAVSQNERGAAALGISPGVVSSATWTIGAALAGVAGILLAPITQASIGGLSLLVIPVLAAVLLGGFSSFPATLLSAMFVGILQTVALNYNDFFDQHLHITVASDGFPLLVVVVVMLIKGTSLPVRGDASERLPAIGSGRVRWALVLPTVGVILALIFFVFSGSVLPAIAVTFTMAILLLSVVVLTGYAGQVSLAQYTLAGVGGLISAQLAAKWGFGFVPALAVGTAAATLVGLLFAVPALRTRGVNLAVITLAAAWAAQDMVFSNLHISGSSDGVKVGKATLFGWDISGSDQPARYAAFTFVVFVLCAVFVANLRRGRLGRRMIAVRSNERAASASGVGVFHTKVTAFAVSGALAGLAGTLISFQYEAISFVTFDPFTSLLVLAWIVMSGVGFIFGTLNPGALLAPGAVLSLVALEWPGFVGWLPIVGGVGALAAVLFNQDGITSNNVKAFHSYAAKHPRLRLDEQPAFDVEGQSGERNRVAPKRLQIADLSVRYGGVVAVDSISIDVGPGEVVGLIGPNGAGKTSLMDAVSGFTPYGGQVMLDGHPIDRWPAHRRASAGLVRSFQGLELFPEMTVLENLQVPQDKSGGWRTGAELIRPEKTALSPVAMAAVQDFGLAPILGKYPDEISYGQRRLVAIARAVAAVPSVLLLDEPVSGLTEHESGEFAHLVRRLADSWGMAVLVIEHDMNFVMSICDRITVIDFGKFVCHGTPAQVRTDRAAIAAYLGDEPEAESPPPRGASKPLSTKLVSRAVPE